MHVGFVAFNTSGHIRSAAPIGKNIGLRSTELVIRTRTTIGMIHFPTYLLCSSAKMVALLEDRLGRKAIPTRGNPKRVKKKKNKRKVKRRYTPTSHDLLIALPQATQTLRAKRRK